MGPVRGGATITNDSFFLLEREKGLTVFVANANA